MLLPNLSNSHPSIVTSYILIMITEATHFVYSYNALNTYFMHNRNMKIKKYHESSHKQLDITSKPM